MLRGILFTIVLLFGNFVGSFSAEKPKLVLVISLDQFRYDYLPRFEKFFGNRGFNLFLKQGASFVNCQYLHSVNKTGPAHAVIMSGTYANVNGIISNEWYDVETNKVVQEVADATTTLIGGGGGAGGSPKNFIGTTVGDQLKESNAGHSKVISIAGKVRTAILMGGKLADAAYWNVDSSFVTSSYYMDDLPEWVKNFNASGKMNSYFGKVWEHVLPENEYAIQGADDVDAEMAEHGMGRTFPHQVDGGKSGISASYFEAFTHSPFASEVLAEFAMQAIVQEQLGQRGVTDILCLGFSANDKIGHEYGPNSHEVMDITIRTDRILEKLFNFIDQKVGLQNCTILSTSDHGVAPLPEVLSAHNNNLQAGRVKARVFETAVEQALTREFGPLQTSKAWIIKHIYTNIYLNPRALRENGITSSAAEQVVKDTLQQMSGIHAVYTYAQLEAGNVSGNLGRKALHSFHPLRSGNIFYQLKPYYIMRKENTGTTHGEPWSYDAHVPMLWYGVGLKPGTYYTSVSVADIAPTLSVILKIEFPAGVQGSVLHELLK